MSKDEPTGHGPDASPTREDEAQVFVDLEAFFLAALNSKLEIGATKLPRDAAELDPRDEGIVASAAPTGEPHSDAEFEALIAAAFGSLVEDAGVAVEGREVKSVGQDDAEVQKLN